MKIQSYNRCERTPSFKDVKKQGNDNSLFGFYDLLKCHEQPSHFIMKEFPYWQMFLISSQDSVSGNSYVTSEEGALDNI